MKLIRLILAFYFTALLIVPCNDVKAKSSFNDSFRVSMNVKDSHSKEKNDNCSPLCMCNCCHITVASLKAGPVLEDPKIDKAYLSKKIHFKKNDFAYLVYDQIWQPPKI